MKRTSCPLYLLVLTLFFELQIQAQTSNAVLLHTGTVVFPENARAYPATAYIAESETVAGNYYRLLQFYEMPQSADFSALESQGIRLLAYIPHKAYLAAIPTAFDVAKFGLLGVRSVMPLSADLKLAAPLRNDDLPEWATTKNRALLMLQFHQNLAHETVLRYCAADGIEVQKSNGYNNFLRVSIPEGKIKEVAALPYVAFLEPIPAPDVPDDIWGRSLHRANVLDTEFPSGRHYTGEGVGLLCRDDGPIGPHIDFQGRLNNTFVIPQDGSHGDGVSGILCGAANLDPRKRGMAAGANLFVLNYEAEFLDETMSLHFDQNVLVTNSSYSNGCNAGYTEVTATVDQQLYQNPTLMHVFSAGNSNNNDCGYGAGDQWGNITGGHKQAKNAIATANLLANSTLDNSSSRGPAHDGRIKPDIAANGTNHVSTDEGNVYQVFGGTSGASPGIAGILAQLHQAYRESNGGNIAPAALLKATLLNTANDLGNLGPDFKFGWGHVNAFRAGLAIEEHRHLSGTVAAGLGNSHLINVPEGVKQARIMVYWADPEASVMSSKALQNDLNATVESPNGLTYLPWVLNHLPDVNTLNDPATTGTDTLNNMEQIAITDPEAGEYALLVSASELPFGDHPYFVVWEFRMADVITLTHPVGGESFAPGDTLRLHWDAEGENGNFTLAYSSDGGSNWTDFSTVNATERLKDWVVPNQVGGNVKVQVTRGSYSDANDEVFAIAPRPQNLQVSQACPDYIRFEWNPVTLTGTTPVYYQINLLGDKYMEPMDTVTDVFFDLPTTDPSQDHWVAVRAFTDGGIFSERTIAVNHNGGLLQCTQNIDMSMVSIESPQAGNIFSCGQASLLVSVTVQNTGLTPQSGVQVAYDFPGQATVTESLPGTIQPGGFLSYTFNTPLQATENGDNDLTTYIILPDDMAGFNNDQSVQLNVTIYSGSGEPLNYSEDFEGTPFLPPFFLLNNYDESITWDSLAVIGITGDSTACLWMNNYPYNAPDELDEVVVVPVNLENATGPQLTFDLSYARFDNQYFDGLRVEVSSDCGLTFSNTVYEKFGTELATVPDDNDVYFPIAAAQWRTEIVPLSQFAGQSVVLKFIAINGYGNSLFLDNINVEDLAPPVASFTASADTICQGESVTFTSTSTGEDISLEWTFGAGASPSVFSGEGPVSVTFSDYGDFTPTLSVTNAAATVTATNLLNIQPLPVPDFTWLYDSEQVTFTNNSQFAGSFFWSYGDGNGGISANPTHTHEYDSMDVFTVTLTASNGCGSVSTTQEVVATLTATQDLASQLRAFLSPNPTDGAFELTIENEQAQALTLELSDMRGVVLQSEKWQKAGGRQSLGMDVSGLVPGVYFLKIRGEEGRLTLKIVVE